MEWNKEHLEHILIEILKQLYDKDKYLIDKKICERSIVFRFGIYLEEYIKKHSLLKDFDLDSEYNKHLGKKKTTNSRPNGSYPDLIIHKRGCDSNNILVMEFKLIHNSYSKDRKKLIDYTIENGDYKYRYGVFIKIGNTTENCEFVWFKNGKVVADE